MRDSTRRWLLTVIAVPAALALFAAGCGDDDEGGGESSVDQTDTSSDGVDDADPSEILGTANPADGEPFIVGFPVDAGGEALDVSEHEIAASAAEEYVNEYLGGIDGRPLEIQFCDTRQSAGTATQCANEFIQSGVSAVLVATTGFGELIAGAMNEAGIPYVARLGATLPELTGETSFTLTGDAISILGTPALFLQDNDLTKLGLLAIDVPTATQAVELLAAPAYERAGLELQLITVPPGTADMSANVSTGLDSDAWLVLGDTTFCTTALGAIQTQAPDAPIFASGQCISPDAADSLPNGFDGVRTSTAVRLADDDPETMLFETVLDVYADEDLAGLARGFLADAFSVVVAFDRMMDGYTGDGSAESVLTQLSTAQADLPLGGGIEIDCGNPAFELLPRVCSFGGWLTELDATGSPTDYEMVDPAPLFAG